MDVDKFTKLMKMTTSPHDGEALTAIRMANAMLSKHKLSWDDAIKITRVTSPPPPPSRRPYGGKPGGFSASDFTSWEEIKRKAAEARDRARAAHEAADAREFGKDTSQATAIRRMFAYLRKNMEPGDARDFIADIHKVWVAKHKLDASQLAGLWRVYKNTMKAHGHEPETMS